MKSPVNLRPMDPARRRWYVVVVLISAMVVGAAWLFTLSQTVFPEISRAREAFGGLIEKTAESIKQIRIDK